MSIKPLVQAFVRKAEVRCIVALMCSCIINTPLYSLPLVETIFTLPENSFACTTEISYIKARALFRRERAVLGFGVWDDLSITYTIEYVHQESNDSESVLGDSLFKIWYYAGEFTAYKVCWGVAGIVRLPTGPSMYASERWHSVSSGIHELKIGPVFQMPFLPFVYHMNFFYVFRQAEGEDYYGGFAIKPFEGETYASMFGLNPWHRGSFADKNRLKNDYLSIALSVLTQRFFPFICYVEWYYSHRVAPRSSDNDYLTVEGAGVNPLLVSAGIRYFLSPAAYIACSGIVSIACPESFSQWVATLSVSAVF